MSKIHLDRLRARKKSWTFFSSWMYDKQQWARKYLDNITDPPSREMLFGSEIGKKLETDPTFLPFIPRHCKMEHPFSIVFNGIDLIGYADSFCTKTNRKLIETKTGKKEWTQERADEHGQITLYVLFNYVTNKVNPEEVEIDLVWMPTRENGSFDIEFVEPIEKTTKIFRTKRTLSDIMKMGKFINDTMVEMEKFAIDYK